MRCSKCHFENPDDTLYCGKCGTKVPSSEKIPVSHTKTLETPIKELTRGTTFAGRYEIIDELGKGGMGKVYRVEDKKIKEELALKLIKPEIAADRKTIERFSNELKMAHKISHKNVCRMYHLGEEEGTHFITMEYVPGEDLKSFIRRSGQLTIKKAITIAKQVCEGLAEAHRLGVIHRDLKPQNIMIDKEGNARIMDFGIARSLKAKGITGAGVMIGTPEYMSPEQAEAKEVDQRSDIYSLGVILYEMVTGRVPFEGETPLSVAIKHKIEAPTTPKDVNAQIPEDLNRMILRCMEKDKEKRYQTAEKLLFELSTIEKGIPTTERMVPKRKPITSKEITVKFGLRKLLIPALVFISLVIVGVIIWQLLPQKEPVSLQPQKLSIAILPFEDLSPNKDQEYFCDGIADELINRLTNIESLRVPARTSAFSFKGKGLDIREIGKKLEVENVLEGSIRKAGKKLRITVQLVNVIDGYPLWSEKYERDEEDVFALQDEISLAIVDKLQLKLLAGERDKLVKRHTENLEAYNLYLKGLYFWNKRTGEGMRKGMGLFQQAIEKDPAYALAYTGLADSFSILSFWCFLSPKDAFPKARALAEKALEIDDSLAEAYASLAWISFSYDWDWSAAESGFKKAVELNPGYAMARQWYAVYLSGMGRHDEAITEIKKALELDPLSIIINTNVGTIYHHKRRYDKAIEQLQKTLEMDPNFSQTHYSLGKAYIMKGMYKEAIAAGQKARELGLFWGTAILGYTYGLSGEVDKATKLIHELEELSKKRYVSLTTIASIYAGLGEVDKYFEWIEKAYKERDTGMPYIKVMPTLDCIRSDPRYKELLMKMGLE